MTPHGARALHEQRPLDRLVGDVLGALREAVRDTGRAALCVPGRGLPTGVLADLGRGALEWSRVFVTVPDDAWVVPHHPASLEGALRRAWQGTPAADARLVPLASGGLPLEVAAGWAPPAFDQPFDAVVLAVGDDGAVGALVPGGAGVREALHAPPDRGAVALPGDPPRVTLTGPRLAWTRRLALVAPTPAAAQVVDRGLDGDLPADHPVRWLLERPDTPLVIYREG